MAVIYFLKRLAINSPLLVNKPFQSKLLYHALPTASTVSHQYLHFEGLYTVMISICLFLSAACTYGQNSNLEAVSVDD